MRLSFSDRWILYGFCFKSPPLLLSNQISEVWLLSLVSNYLLLTTQVSLILTVCKTGYVQDKVEANRGWLWVLKEMLWESNWGKQEVAEGGSGTEGTQIVPTVLHANDPSHHPHHVPFMWTCCCPTISHICRPIVNTGWASSAPPNGS